MSIKNHIIDKQCANNGNADISIIVYTYTLFIAINILNQKFKMISTRKL
jgi:hypothetical protein